MKVCVQGLWHLGNVTAAALASVGHDVTGLDDSPRVIAKLRLAEPPVFEPGLGEMLAAQIAAGRLQFAEDAGMAVREAEVLWIAHDTPVDENDVADVDHVFERTLRTLPHLPTSCLVLISSQLPAGSVRRLEALAASRWPGKALRFACSPENLRLGNALKVFLSPDRIVVGCRRDTDRETLERLLHPICERLEWMSVESAEMTKHAINAFLATSVTFANEIAVLCEAVGADAKAVERGLKSESRIGPKAYLSPGAAFAGGTLARDVEFLRDLGSRRSLANPLLGAIRVSNDLHKGWTERKLVECLGDLAGRTIGVWGLTYKPGTSTLRRSLSVELCGALIARGARLRVHDPAAEDLPVAWADAVERCDDPIAATADVHALVVATEWPEYRRIADGAGRRLAPGQFVLDPNRFLAAWSSIPSIRYLSVGSGSPRAVPDHT
jgi:UDPglucose 6-dehydrogenase